MGRKKMSIKTQELQADHTVLRSNVNCRQGKRYKNRIRTQNAVFQT